MQQNRIGKTFIFTQSNCKVLLLNDLKQKYVKYRTFIKVDSKINQALTLLADEQNRHVNYAKPLSMQT